MTEKEISVNQGNLLRAVMLLKGVKITDLAKKLGVSHSYISAVIHNKKKNKRIFQQILKELGFLPSSHFDHFDFTKFLQNSQDCYFIFQSYQKTSKKGEADND